MICYECHIEIVAPWTQVATAFLPVGLGKRDFCSYRCLLRHVLNLLPDEAVQAVIKPYIPPIPAPENPPPAPPEPATLPVDAEGVVTARRSQVIWWRGLMVGAIIGLMFGILIGIVLVLAR